MTVAIPQDVLRRVAAHFDRATLARGLKCAEDGRVRLVRSEWPVVAQVRGENSHVVTVHHTPESQHVRGDCSCSDAVDCEHAVATALVALAGAREASTERAEARAQQAVGDWLSEFAVRTAAPADRGGRAIVAYVIGRRDGQLGVTVQRSTRLRRGGFGRGVAIGALADPARGAPAWVEAEDLRRIALLRAVTRAGPSELFLPIERVDGALLRDLADSGHLFWEQVGSRPLAAGPERRGALGWYAVEGPPGGYRVGLESSLVLVAAHETHYIDPGRATLGPLDVGVPATVVHRLVHGPPVPEAMLATVRRSLRPLLGDAAEALAPEGSGDDDLHVDRAPMRPHLTVTVEEDEGGASRVEAHAEAVYAGERFELASWDPRRAAPRDLVEETRRRRRLDELLGGFVRRGRAATRREVLAEARHVAHEVVPVLANEGWHCELAAEFPAEPVADVDAWVETLEPLSETRGWFSLALGVEISGRTVPLLPILLRALRDGTLSLDPEVLATEAIPGINLRLPDGELVHVPGERLRRWLRPLVELELRGLDDAGALVVPDVTAVDIADASADRFGRGDRLAEARARAERLLSLEPAREPPSFAGALRPYQREGLAWMRLLHDGGHGGLLADDMGLGKTVQLLAFLDGLRAEGALGASAPALVVAPRSVIGHWCDEAARFAGELAPVRHLGPDRPRRLEALRRAPLVVTSYQTLHRDRELLARVPWTTVVFDEAQMIKNPDARVRRAAASLRARSRFCVTGTPIENHLRELWSQIDLVMPGLLGRKATFEAVFRRPVEKYGDARALAFLRRRLRPFLLRRDKRGVDLDLPDKTEIVEPVDLEPAQRDLYESLRLSLDHGVRRALRDRGVQGSSLVVLDALLKLRQCCCDPRLVNTPQAQQVTSSAKLERLMSMLEELADSGRFALVFSQFTSMIRLIEAACRAANIRHGKLTGATRRRDDVVRAFQDGEVPVLLVSLKAGGTGLNLTRADTVIHYDPWWNPAAEDQATDRAHRIGQDQNVFVYKLVARGTLEERIAAMQAEKRALTTAALREGGATHLSAADLGALYHELV